ncbi:flagellin [Telmatobacter bradus]|jgi:flagellin|uniref:flagellin N-terminal helical domain-containing protein n=1 Tax=Telmatobacter bradus TaxID=474953 RepID=UPI003B42DE25
MSLGVLNNLNAAYAEYNLNNTNNGLSKTLQQLSSGSKINSGADDAAGLSLVNGLQSNQQALSQSTTNATEGVGLLQVADGALSQVTSLLNRAVTLATEVSNGTLNSSQQSAANQEYQSILSEISNIGSTTTYNQNQVFGGPDVSIYVGDSSAGGSSVDSLHFATVSSSSVGDAGGKINYSQGQGVFQDVTKGGSQVASANDLVGAGQNITVTGYDADSGKAFTAYQYTTNATDTMSTIVNKVNSAGLGLVASVQTSEQATGDTSTTGRDLGIEVRGNISADNAPTAVGTFQLSQVTLKDQADSGATGAASIQSGIGTAQISYTSKVGGAANLTTYDLSSQSNAQSALTVLNKAIANVAAQDGYIGAQINTLNAVTNVISTQQENIQSAQNAVQATDYATASSNMSKYEILSQTGISALAQANSIQQEVTKLLQ